ncbi:thiamine ABC transporter substrate-binding protein [Micropruina sp.]|uniref:thiamine ABC transporter substrate-binding protein n=1 Tax=Micropruina sp. TaxID=2737536 RepID=UPI002630E231|nr:thiamine ABC transporter substrate-binding protein [Micropruina sp.]
MSRNTRKIAVGAAALLSGMGLLAGCGSMPAGPSSGPASSSASAPTESKKLTVVTHDSFALSDELKKEFADSTGYAVTYVQPGDGGALVNQLILSKDSPLGDVVYGIDNTFAGRALAEGVVTPYTPASVPESVAKLAADDSGRLTAIDLGDVCVNADKKWFADKKLALPATLNDLTKPEYKDLLVVENPASSSPGLAWLTATVGAQGDPGYLEYWKALKNNGVKVVKGWTEAYSTEFSGSSGKGSRPLVVSYSTSPAFEVPKGGKESNTTALLQTCFRQVEYAGVIAGAQNEVGARKFIDFLLTKKVQADIPGEMYMYPADSSVELPKDWQRFAPLAEQPFSVPAETISAKRDSWIREWTATVIG